MAVEAGTPYENCLILFIIPYPRLTSDGYLKVKFDQINKNNAS